NELLKAFPTPEKMIEAGVQKLMDIKRLTVKHAKDILELASNTIGTTSPAREFELVQIIENIQHYEKLIKQANHFFDLIEEHLETVNKEFRTVFKTFLKYKSYIINALELPYSNAKLEATNKLIKGIKRQAFGFRKFKNFKTKILIALNTQKERTRTILSRC
ncbi:transposase, partial [Streptococcus pluranimalium]|uniref:transposase n=1 Tax=Streptococcus pluranimalium TaxID=82348 RepID=UPI0039FD4E0B